jgi:hypothetical protein
MNTTLIKLLPCIVWGAVAVSSATPANAQILTAQSGSYAACSQDYDYNRGGDFPCGDLTFFAEYLQRIRLVGTPCSSGGCAPDSGDVYTEFLYDTGRHFTMWQTECSGYNVYALGTCNC